MSPENENSYHANSPQGVELGGYQLDPVWCCPGFAKDNFAIRKTHDLNPSSDAPRKRTMIQRPYRKHVVKWTNLVIIATCFSNFETSHLYVLLIFLSLNSTHPIYNCCISYRISIPPIFEIATLTLDLQSVRQPAAASNQPARP